MPGGWPLPRVARYGVDSDRYDLAGREWSSLWHLAKGHGLRQHYRGLGSYEFGCRGSTAGLPSTRTANNAAAITRQPFSPDSQVSISAGKTACLPYFHPPAARAIHEKFYATSIGHLVVSYGTRNIEDAAVGPGLRDCRPGLLVSCGLPMA